MKPSPKPGSLRDFFRSLRYWWTRRPRRILCSECGHRLWYNDVDTPQYCGWECARHGEARCRTFEELINDIYAAEMEETE